MSGAVVVVTKLGASLALVAFWLGLRDTSVEIHQGQLVALGVGLATLGGFLFKQFNKFKNRKLRFMKPLAENLYFKNLDNNAGVFHHLVDAAEEEGRIQGGPAGLPLFDTKREGAEPAGAGRALESWFAADWDCDIDFEVDDALAKLERWGLVRRQINRLTALPVPEAKTRLDQLWDNFFTYQ